MSGAEVTIATGDSRHVTIIVLITKMIHPLVLVT